MPPDARERIPAIAGGAAQSDHFSGLDWPRFRERNGCSRRLAATIIAQPKV